MSRTNIQEEEEQKETSLHPLQHVFFPDGGHAGSLKVSSVDRVIKRPALTYGESKLKCGMGGQFSSLHLVNQFDSFC